MKMQKMCHVALVLAMVSCAAHQADGQTAPKPSDPLRVSAKQLTPTPQQPNKPPHSTLIEGHAFLTDGTTLFSREVTCVFGANSSDGEGLDFRIIPYLVPTTGPGIPSTQHYSRPALHHGFVYARAKKSEAYEQSLEQTNERFLRAVDDLVTTRLALTSLQQDADMPLEAEKFIDRRVLIEAMIQRDRQNVAAFTQVVEQKDALDRAVEITRDTLMGDKNYGFGLFRLIIGIVIDGGVPGTDIVLYAEPGEYDFGGDGNKNPATIIHMVLVEGTDAIVFEKPSSTTAKAALNMGTNYVRYAVPADTPDPTPVQLGSPVDFCGYVHDPANGAEYLCKVVKLAGEVFLETTGESAHFPCANCIPNPE